MKRTIMMAVFCVGLAVPVYATAQSLPLPAIAQQVRKAVTANPANADTIAGAAFALTDGSNDAANAIASSAIRALIRAGLSDEAVSAEAIEIAAALFAQLESEDSQQELADLIASLTPDPEDSGETVAQAASDFQTADTPLATGDLGNTPGARVPSFVSIPSSSSPN